MPSFLKSHRALILAPLLISLAGCGGGGGGTPPPPAISVSLAPAGTANIDGGQSLNFTASVANDSSSQGVTWSLTGTGCTGDACGTLSNTTATTAQYNAPMSLSAELTVSVKATSKADMTKSASTTVVVKLPPSITTTTLPSGTAGSAYSATLQATGGVGTLTWSVESGSSLPAGLSLSSAGVISGTPTTPGTSMFYVLVTDAASTPLSDHKQLNITITAAAACGSGSESVLSGQYAFTLSGYNGTNFLAVVGSFTANGTGGITAGEADSNGALGVQHANLDTSGSSYSVDSNHRGCATIVTSFGTFVTRFALDAGAPATKGRIIEFDTPNSSAYIASGEIRKQDPTSFSGGLSGNYAFREAGAAGTGGRVALSGVLSASGGSFSNGEEDYNAGGTTYHFTGMTGSYSGIDANGRGTATVVIQPVMVTNAFAAYMVSGSEIVFVTTDDPATNFVAVGEMRKQSGTFSSSSLNGVAVFAVAGLTGSGTGSEVTLGTFTGNGSGSANITIYDNYAGSLTSDSFPCGYTVASNGRTTLSGDCSGAPVLYLTAANTAFMLGMDSSVPAGEAEPQAAGPFSNASVSGTFFMGTAAVVSQSTQTGVGSVTLDGSGNVNGVSDYTWTSGQDANMPFTDTYSVNSDGTFTTGSGTAGLVISGTKFVMFDQISSTYPSILVIQK